MNKFTVRPWLKCVFIQWTSVRMLKLTVQTAIRETMERQENAQVRAFSRR